MNYSCSVCGHNELEIADMTHGPILVRPSAFVMALNYMLCHQVLLRWLCTVAMLLQ